MAKSAVRDKAAIRAAYDEDKRSGRVVGTRREYRRFWKSQSKDLQRGLATEILKRLPSIQLQFPRLQSRFVGVLCLTSNPNSVVMWSHYADKHRGFVIELDSSWQRFSEAKGLRPVRYSEQRPTWDEALTHGNDALDAQFDAVVFQKNDEWRYECELRQLFLLHGLETKPLEDGKTGYFLPIPASLIVSVRLGMFCSNEFVAEVKDALMAPSLSHVALKKAVPDEAEFCMRAIDA
jgi:hypothetical protein